MLPEQTLAESLAANIDSAAPEGAVTPLDAALLLQQRVGTIDRFPVQARASENHPGPGALPADKELAPRSGVVSLRWAGEDLLIWLDSRDGILAVDAHLRGVGAADTIAVPRGFMSAHRRSGDNWRVVMASAIPLHGAGPPLKMPNVDATSIPVLEQFFINDQPVTISHDRRTSPMPRRWRLDQNRPNPLNGSTLIPLSLPQTAHVRASVVNLLGQQVRHLRDDRLAAGDHLLHWDGTDDRGHDLATRMYAVRVRVDGQERRRRVMLLR